MIDTCSVTQATFCPKRFTQFSFGIIGNTMTIIISNIITIQEAVLLRAELGIQSTHKLTERSYIRNLKVVNLSLNEYALRIIQECRDLNLIGDDIWIWDRRFFECNCSGIKDKKTGHFSDPDAGHYVKKTGRYSVLTGTGFTDTGFVDRSWSIPVYWDAVGANKNDNTILKQTAYN